jgi:hypothetical protein
MLVYGDHVRLESPNEKLQTIESGIRQISTTPAGLARHSQLVALLIEAGELAQGLLDFEFRRHKADGFGVFGRRCMRLTGELARQVWTSHRSGFATFAPLNWRSVENLRALQLPEEVEIRVPEGYAFYALYPESYGEAAQAWALGRSDIQIIGIRSIGTSLAGMVFAAVGARRLPLTVRPVGPHFDRQLALKMACKNSLGQRARDGTFAAVDEGPGLSGSSFCAVAELLLQLGVETGRIHFFPGHLAGPGPQASPARQSIWAMVAKHHFSFEEVFLRDGSPLQLSSLVADLTGPSIGPIEDLSAGAWRQKLFSSAEHWPPAHVQQERRKYLVASGSGNYLLKFIGLGSYGQKRFERARRLAKAGFIPPALGLRHGFLVQPWMQGTRPLSTPIQRGRNALVARVAEYLSFLAREFPAARSEGASPERLFKSALHNVQEYGDVHLAKELERLESGLSGLESSLRPIQSDNKMHAWEWLELADGRLLKTDALDHCQGHDWIGCQDVAWDVAGAQVELGFSPQERQLLLRALEEKGRVWLSPAKLDFYLLCYLGFQLGYFGMAAAAMAAFPDEAGRARREAERYHRELVARLR